MIRVRDLRYTYPRATDPALRGMSFDVEPGEVFGFLGPSGAGKTTTQGVLVGTLVVAALGGPVIALVFGTLAATTIEGLALSKLVNLVVLLPVVAIAIVPTPLQFVAGVFPTYWPVAAVVAGVAGDPLWPAYLLAGIVAHLLALAGHGWQFGRRAD